MIRTVGLACIFLSVIAAAAIAKMIPGDLPEATAPAVPPNAYLHAATPGSSVPVMFETHADTLRKADKLLVMRAVEDRPVTDPVSPLRSPAVAPISSAPTAPTRKIVSRHCHDPLAVTASTKVPEPRQAKLKRKNKAVASIAAGAEAPSCPDGAAVLRALKVLPACQSVTADAYSSSQ